MKGKTQNQEKTQYNLDVIISVGWDDTFVGEDQGKGYYYTSTFNSTNDGQTYYWAYHFVN